MRADEQRAETHADQKPRRNLQQMKDVHPVSRTKVGWFEVGTWKVAPKETGQGFPSAALASCTPRTNDAPMPPHAIARWSTKTTPVLSADDCPNEMINTTGSMCSLAQHFLNDMWSGRIVVFERARNLIRCSSTAESLRRGRTGAKVDTML
jgi:hypothetical protein